MSGEAFLTVGGKTYNVRESGKLIFVLQAFVM
jgi:hypothetical protein